MIRLYDETYTREIPIINWTFPGGERGLKLKENFSIPPSNYYKITLRYQSSDDLVDLMLLKDILDHVGAYNVSLIIPYLPFARQDRRMLRNDSHALKVFAEIINSLKFTSVNTWDVHSTVSEGLINRLYNTPQSSLAIQVLIEKKLITEDVLFLAPDAGASKKIYDTAKAFKADVVIAEKVRSMEDGSIIATKVSDVYKLLHKDVWIVDDICDGGKTFIEIAKALEGICYKSLNLYTTHGIYSKGKQCLFDAGFTNVECYNNMEKV